MRNRKVITGIIVALGLVALLYGVIKYRNKRADK